MTSACLFNRADRAKALVLLRSSTLSSEQLSEVNPCSQPRYPHTPHRELHGSCVSCPFFSRWCASARNSYYLPPTRAKVNDGNERMLLPTHFSASLFSDLHGRSFLSVTRLVFCRVIASSLAMSSAHSSFIIHCRQIGGRGRIWTCKILARVDTTNIYLRLASLHSATCP